MSDDEEGVAHDLMRKNAASHIILIIQSTLSLLILAPAAMMTDGRSHSIEMQPLNLIQ